MIHMSHVALFVLGPVLDVFVRLHPDLQHIQVQPDPDIHTLTLRAKHATRSSRLVLICMTVQDINTAPQVTHHMDPPFGKVVQS